MTADLAHPCPVCSAPAGEPCDVPCLPLCAHGVHIERVREAYTVDELLAAFAAFSPVPVARAVALVRERRAEKLTQIKVKR